MAGLTRTMLLRLAASPNAAEMATRLGSGAASRFVAGETLDEAIARTRALNEKGYAVTLDHLGESVATIAAAREAAAEYVAAAEALHEARADATMSLKLTQMGLDVDEAACRENVADIVKKAGERGIFVRIDMESSAYVDRTLDLYRWLRAEGHDNVGIVLQAYLRRSPADLAGLASLRPDVRIVKGAYEEPASIAHRDRERIRRAYRELVDAAFDTCSRVAVATHDDALVTHVEALLHRGAAPADRVEFQMLYGVRGELAERTRKGGYRVRIYLPYGRDWFPYFMRRLAERPSDAWRFARVLLSARGRA